MSRARVILLLTLLCCAAPLLADEPDQPPRRVNIPERCFIAWHAVAIRPNFDWTQVYGWLKQLYGGETVTIEGCSIGTAAPADVLVPNTILHPTPEQFVGLAQLPRVAAAAADEMWRSGCVTARLPNWPAVELCQTEPDPRRHGLTPRSE